MLKAAVWILILLFLVAVWGVTEIWENLSTIVFLLLIWGGTAAIGSGVAFLIGFSFAKACKLTLDDYYRDEWVKWAALVIGGVIVPTSLGMVLAIAKRDPEFMADFTPLEFVFGFSILALFLFLSPIWIRACHWGFELATKKEPEEAKRIFNRRD